jgi:hypothetical protein
MAATFVLYLRAPQNQNEQDWQYYFWIFLEMSVYLSVHCFKYT